MSSIDLSVRRVSDFLRKARYRWTWHRRIRPAATHLTQTSTRLGQPGSDDAESWYTTVEPDRPNIVRIEIADVGDALSAQWRSAGRDELVDAADGVADLVAASRVREEAGSELSDDVYAMY